MVNEVSEMVGELINLSIERSDYSNDFFSTKQRFVRHGGEVILVSGIQ